MNNHEWKKWREVCSCNRVVFFVSFIVEYIRMPYTTIWYKTMFTRARIVFIWLVLLFLINYQLFFSWDYGTIFATVVVAYILHVHVRIVNKLRYTFSDDQIEISLPSGKKYLLEWRDMLSLESIKRSRRQVWLGAKYKRSRREIHFTTSNHNLLLITMRDERKVIISPRIIKKEVYSIGKNQ